MEQVVNQAVGFVISSATNYYVLPLMGLPVSVGKAATLTVVFSTISAIRGYFIRRWFNHMDNKKND